jgi:hypothetical protein
MLNWTYFLINGIILVILLADPKRFEVVKAKNWFAKTWYVIKYMLFGVFIMIWKLIKPFVSRLYEAD